MAGTSPAMTPKKWLNMTGKRSKCGARGATVVGWAKPTGPAFGRPDDRLRVPTAAEPLVGTAREKRAFAHPTSDSG
jgi:hypothetical protein